MQSFAAAEESGVGDSRAQHETNAKKIPLKRN
jgi:hypothetical protein